VAAVPRTRINGSRLGLLAVRRLARSSMITKLQNENATFESPRVCACSWHFEFTPEAGSLGYSAAATARPTMQPTMVGRPAVPRWPSRRPERIVSTWHISV